MTILRIICLTKIINYLFSIIYEYSLIAPILYFIYYENNLLIFSLLLTVFIHFFIINVSILILCFLWKTMQLANDNLSTTIKGVN